MSVRAVLFDWDNTLIDSWACIQESYNIVFRHFNMPEWSMDETKANVAKSLRDSFPHMFGARWEEARDVFYQGFEAIHLDFLRPLDHAEEMLRTLSEKGIVLGVVSNKSGRFLRAEADILGWGKYFHALIGALDAERDKPDPAPVFLALRGTEISPGAEVIFVGDSPVDIECANNSGCRSVLLRDSPPQEGEDFPYPHDYHVKNCCELSALVCDLWVPISGN